MKVQQAEKQVCGLQEGPRHNTFVVSGLQVLHTHTTTMGHSLMAEGYRGHEM
jgi:hypothetical protein